MEQTDTSVYLASITEVLRDYLVDSASRGSIEECEQHIRFMDSANMRRPLDEAIEAAHDNGNIETMAYLFAWYVYLGF